MSFSGSRRSLLCRAAAVSGAGLLRQVASGQKGSGRRVLALIGDRYHNADYIEVALNKMFEGQGVMVDYTIDYRQLSRNLLSNYQLFLCLRDGMIWSNGYLGPDAYTAYEQGLEAENLDGLKYENLGMKSIAGWAYDYRRGRVVFTSPGHTIHSLWVPEYFKLQRRAVQWLLKEI